MLQPVARGAKLHVAFCLLCGTHYDVQFPTVSFALRHTAHCPNNDCGGLVLCRLVLSTDEYEEWGRECASAWDQNAHMRSEGTPRPNFTL